MVINTTLVSTLMCQNILLQLGEVESIVLAHEIAADRLLLDETQGRLSAASLGVPVIGLLGVLIEAKQQGLVAAVKPLLDDLISVAGFWIGKQLYAQVLKIANE